jgi:hypothetical protein
VRLAVRVPPGREPERGYAVAATLGDLLGTEWDALPGDGPDFELAPAGDGFERRLAVADSLLAVEDARWLAPASLPAEPVARWREAPGAAELPVLYGAGELVDEGERGLRLGLDVFGAVFWCLTRYEELARPVRDEHGRFPSSELVAARGGFLDRPVADEHAGVLWTALERVWPRLERPRRAPRTLLSHDVDWPRSTAGAPLGAVARAAAADLARRRDPALAARRLASRAGRARDPNDTFDLVMGLAEARGLRGAFYFIPATTDPRFDPGYSLDDPWMRALMRRLHERGHEVGLHPSYATHLDAGATRAEADALRRACARLGIEQAEWGGRQHFLRWENPVTWRNWEAAGMDYDSTLGFSDAVGFRSGTCREHRTFDLRERRTLRLRERPLVAMEQALVDAGDDEAALAAIERLHARCRRHGGDFTLLWHNSRLITRRERALYRRALDLL